MARSDFVIQLKALGYEVQEKGGNRVAFRYSIPVGRFLGQDIMLGFEVADDFPLSPPSGPHTCPCLLPMNSTRTPPDGGIHKSDGFGPDWQYWSRPFENWQSTDRTVKTYMAHIRHVFAAIE